MEREKLFILEKNQLDRLIQLLRADGYRVIGPRIGDGALVYGEIASAEQLPRGWTQESESGVYRLKRRGDEQYFGHTVGPHSWKRFLFPPRLRLYSITRNGEGSADFTVQADAAAGQRMAFVGVRACDLAALGIHDQVFGGEMADPHYAALRRDVIIVAVNCTEPSDTCFCASMGTGPRCLGGFDLVLTEMPDSIAAQAGNERGAALLAQLSAREADANTRRLLDLMVAQAAEHMVRTLDTTDLPRMLLEHPEHPRWAQVAERCLACANCTMVCPTCFCSSVEDSSDLTGRVAERWRVWGSCFTLEFSYHTGGFVRSSTRARYRQWLTHKLAGWHEQFGTSGCVGCGRCIAWCPVGIDITEEAAAIAEDVRRSEAFKREATKSGPSRKAVPVPMEAAP